MAVDDIYKCSAVFDATGIDGDLVVTHHYRQAGIDTTLTESGYCAELASQLRIAYVADFMPEITDDMTLDRVDCFNVTQPQYAGLSVSGQAGGKTVTDPLPYRTAIVVARKTGLRGRSYNGRMFLPGIVEEDQNGGVIETSFKTDLQVFVDGIIDLVTGNDNDYSGVVYSEVLAIGTQITDMVIRDVLGSQRGRQKVT